jgi:hypothetical protein
MSKEEVKNSIISVLIHGIKIYFSNIDKYVLYMLFPVFGQVIGILLSFGLSLGLAEKVMDKVDDPLHALLIVLLLALPGLLIFAKAFWDYMVAYVALNSMTQGALTTGKVYDIPSHKEVATRRTLKYIGLLLVVGILCSVATSIFFIIPGFVLWVYFILVFQVFTFETELDIPGNFKRSFVLIRGNWFRTFILLAILIFFSIFIITAGVTVVFDYLGLSEKIYNCFTNITNLIPLDLTNKILVHLNMPLITPHLIAQWIWYSILAFVVSGLTLPIRSVCWTLWYLSLTEIQPQPVQPRRRYKKKKQADEDE